MPDVFDYAEWAPLLARPHSWTPAELEVVRRQREVQADALMSAHPNDERGRRRLQAVLDDIDRAIAAWRGAEA